MFKELNIKKLNKEEIKNILDGIDLSVDKQSILEFIINNQNKLLY